VKELKKHPSAGEKVRMSFGAGNNGSSPFGGGNNAPVMTQSNVGPDLEEIQTEVGEPKSADKGSV
jgi:hypothetical protein